MVAAVLAALVVARIGIALGAPSDAMQLQLPAFAVFTVVGVIVGAIGWSVVRRVAARPAAVLRWLVPVTLTVLFVPDILLGLGGQPWSTVVTLMVMHVVVAAVAVVTYLRAMPVV